MVSLAERTGFVAMSNGIEQDPETAETRVPVDIVCPAALQRLSHIMPLVPLDRDGDGDADLIVYHRVEGRGAYVLVGVVDVRRATGDDLSKRFNFDPAAECEAEYAAAVQLLRRDRHMR